MNTTHRGFSRNKKNVLCQHVVTLSLKTVIMNGSFFIIITTDTPRASGTICEDSLTRNSKVDIGPLGLSVLQILLSRINVGDGDKFMYQRGE